MKAAFFRRHGGLDVLEVPVDPHELARMPRKQHAPLTEGHVESRAFEMFMRGKTVAEVVIALRITSDDAWQLREKWVDASAQPAKPVAIDVLENTSDEQIES